MGMDVSLNTEVRGYGAQVVPFIEKEDKVKPQVAPVKEGTDSSKARMDDQALHGKKGEQGTARTALSRTEMEKILAQVQSRIDSIGGNLSLGLKEDKPTKDIVVQVKDRRNDKLIRQFPSEDLLKLQSRMEDLAGILFDEKA
jgi:uncharacterized FlaG/YvyC family protein